MTERERASISRERKVARTSGMYKAGRMSNPMTKPSVQDRIKECPDHHFAYVKGQLRCDGCHEIVAANKTIVQKHVQSRKHLNGIANIKGTRAKAKVLSNVSKGK